MCAAQDDRRFLLPSRIETTLAQVSTYFGKANKLLPQRIIVNAQYSVEEGFDYDNWNGGTYGHAIRLRVAAELFAEVVDKLDEVEQEIRDSLQKFGKQPNEYWSRVDIELASQDVESDWRAKSGLLADIGPQSQSRKGDPSERIWKPGYLRLFLSHKSNFKRETSLLKTHLERYGVDCFVAHEDIEPTREWLKEIEAALMSMDALAALLTPDFSESNWTDQEVGVAIGRKVPVFPMRLGKDPYGLIGKFQGVPCKASAMDGAAAALMSIAWKNSILLPQLKRCTIARLVTAETFSHAQSLWERIETFDSLEPMLIEEIERAYQENKQVAKCWRVQSSIQEVMARLRGKPIT
jgi:hypothetical protein